MFLKFLYIYVCFILVFYIVFDYFFIFCCYLGFWYFYVWGVGDCVLSGFCFVVGELGGVDVVGYGGDVLVFLESDFLLVW